ncbi:hypothetical protein ACHAW5_002927 [Stephanodiscus triporus]|uniref:Vps72/YL1 C-terminal domain-containing protein n=1 Tax=Stephanodiscus triporus TaxID=2934178 RepID=A0ABD3N455_9STRA
MPRSPTAKAAVLERSRRSTAGKRMSSLVGKAQEDDDAFWSHSIWSEAGGGFADGRSRKRRRDEEAESPSSSTEEEGSEGGGGSGSGDEVDSASDGEGSYRMSDEDSAAAADQFDSDFDESESDEGGEEGEGEGEAERELQAEQRRDAASKRKKNQRLGVTTLQSSSAGRELMKKKTARVTRRGPLGEGWNEGLVLNWPPPPPPSDGTVGPQISDSKLTIVPVIDSMPAIPAIAETTNPPQIPSHPTTHLSADTVRIDKETPGLPPQHNFPIAATSAPASPSPSTKNANHKHSPTKLKNQLKQEAISERKKSQRLKFTQEELILESIKFTETENAKWLNARKRSKEETAQLEKSTGSSFKRSSSNQQPISRFHSRRGCHTTFTFMDMDHLPEILSRGHASPSVGHSTSYACSTTPTRRRRFGSSSSEASESTQPTPEKKYEKCVITGKIARYRDPKSMLGYHDLDAYKELRRRLDAGKLKISRPTVSKSNSSNNGANSKRKFANMSKFAPGQPMMVAEIASTWPNSAKVMVRVTQGGVPVSPPTGMPFNLASEVPSAAEGSWESRKEPPPLLPSLPPVGQEDSFGVTNQNILGGIDLGIKATHPNGHHAVFDKWNATNGVPVAVAANDSKTPDLSKSSGAPRLEQLREMSDVVNDFEYVPFLTDDRSTHLDEGGGALAMGGKETGSGGKANDNNGKVAHLKPQEGLRCSSTSEAASTMLVSNDRVETNAKAVQSNEAIAPPPSEMKIDATNNADGDNEGITTSNDNRTTIEAN